MIIYNNLCEIIYKYIILIDIVQRSPPYNAVINWWYNSYKKTLKKGIFHSIQKFIFMLRIKFYSEALEMLQRFDLNCGNKAIF